MNITDSYLMYAIVASVFLGLLLMVLGIERLISSSSKRSEMKSKIRESRDIWGGDSESADEILPGPYFSAA